jgi:hypothetical protein
MILARKEEVIWLEAVGEEGMLHSILSSLPNLYEEGEEGDPSLPIPEAETKAGDTAAAAEKKPKVDGVPNGNLAPKWMANAREPIENASPSTPSPSDAKEEAASQPLPAESLPVKQEPSGDIDVARNISTPSPDPSTIDSDSTVLNGEPLTDKSPSFTENDATLVDEPITKAEFRETKRTPTPPSEPEPENSDPWPDTPGQPAKAQISLSSLLRQADDLFNRFPPSHPKLDLDKIMGPRSTVFTWAESVASAPSDDELEQYVKTPHLMVLPYVDPVEEVMTKEKEVRRLETKAERRRKLRRNIFSGASMQKRTVFTGAVLALGIAMAVYGIRAPGDAGRGHHRGDLKKLLRYIGGLLFAGGDRFVERLLAH